MFAASASSSFWSSSLESQFEWLAHFLLWLCFCLFPSLTCSTANLIKWSWVDSFTGVISLILSSLSFKRQRQEKRLIRIVRRQTVRTKGRKITLSKEYKESMSFLSLCKHVEYEEDCSFSVVWIPRLLSRDVSSSSFLLSIYTDCKGRWDEQKGGLIKSRYSFGSSP